ncbi:hypothetical protein P378_02400 [Desulforamulus profundi]|uniref:Uncharacterized protein n=1 Tax=Desulforamulus profundi TaxID=1383067 RepID=A0A2C6MEC1_9FIRM|nr:hypothetical protein P378_02400 [Desulforamulus profundi]
MALEDFLARETVAIIQKNTVNKRGSGKSGLLFVDAPGHPQVLLFAPLRQAPGRLSPSPQV